VGTIAGCYVTEGKIQRGNLIRLTRDQVVVHEGKLASLKRFKDDVREVTSGYECGLSIEGFQDIKQGDVIEAYERIPVVRRIAPAPSGREAHRATAAESR
jgi:translation initiation factor IF-2